MPRIRSSNIHHSVQERQRLCARGAPRARITYNAFSNAAVTIAPVAAEIARYASTMRLDGILLTHPFTYGASSTSASALTKALV